MLKGQYLPYSIVKIEDILWKRLYVKDIPNSFDRDTLQNLMQNPSYQWIEKYFSAKLNQWIQLNSYVASPASFDISGIPYVRILQIQGIGWKLLRKQEWSSKLTQISWISIVNPYKGSLDEIKSFIKQQENSFNRFELLCSLDESCSHSIINSIFLNSKISNTPSLKKLAIQSSKLEQKTFEQLAATIHHCSSSIESCIFDSLSCVTDRKFAIFQEQSKILSNLKLSSLSIRDCLIGQYSIKSIVDSVDNTVFDGRSPIMMDFSGCILSKSSIHFLANLIQSGFPLRGLILNNNPIHNDGAMVLGNCLRNQLCQLEHLEVVNCGIKSSGGNSIMSSLEINRSLKLLNLSDNILNDDHSHQFGTLCGAVLRSNSSLTSLNLSHTLLYTITDDFKAGLIENNGLQTISFANNRLGSVGLRHLFDVLTENLIISSINFAGTLLSEEIALELVQVLEKRKTKTGKLMEFVDIRLNDIPQESAVVDQLSCFVRRLQFRSTTGQFIVDGLQEF